MITLETEAASLVVSPVGGRIVSICDLRSGREWIHNWSSRMPKGTDQSYDHETAGGWDECFPTIGGSSADCAPWGRLRDHGDIWGRLPAVIKTDAALCTMSWSVGGVEFRRTLRIAGAVIEADYRITNHGPVEVPWLWSQHALIAVRPGDRIIMDGIGDLSSTWATDAAIRVPHAFVWQGVGKDERNPWNHISGQGDWAAKFFAPTTDCVVAGVESGADAITFQWRAESEIRHFGLWLNQGGWPAGGGLHHVAFEPTSCPCDGLAEAVEKEMAPFLAPGATASWSVRVVLQHASPFQRSPECD